MLKRKPPVVHTLYGTDCSPPDQAKKKIQEAVLALPFMGTEKQRMQFIAHATKLVGGSTITTAEKHTVCKSKGSMCMGFRVFAHPDPDDPDDGGVNYILETRGFRESHILKERAAALRLTFSQYSTRLLAHTDVHNFKSTEEADAFFGQNTWKLGARTLGVALTFFVETGIADPKKYLDIFDSPPEKDVYIVQTLPLDAYMAKEEMLASHGIFSRVKHGVIPLATPFADLSPEGEWTTAGELCSRILEQRKEHPGMQAAVLLWESVANPVVLTERKVQADEALVNSLLGLSVGDDVSTASTDVPLGMLMSDMDIAHCESTFESFADLKKWRKPWQKGFDERRGDGKPFEKGFDERRGPGLPFEKGKLPFSGGEPFKKGVDDRRPPLKDAIRCEHSTCRRVGGRPSCEWCFGTSWVTDPDQLEIVRALKRERMEAFRQAKSARV